MNAGLWALFIAVMFVMGFLAGMDFGDWRLKRELVESGVAEYYLDQNYEKQWRTKPIPKQDEKVVDVSIKNP